MFKILAASLVSISVLTSCASSVTPVPSASSAVATVGPDPSASSSPSASPAATPASTTSPVSSAPSLPPGVASGALPVRGPGKEIGYAVTTASGPDGSVFVLVPEPVTGVVLARLDRAGRPSPGWPIAMTDVEFCRLLLPVGDGTVRLLCSVVELADTSTERALGFDVQGRSLAGWPVDPGPGFWSAGRVVGDALVLYGGDPDSGSRLAIVGSDGAVRHGALMPEGETTGASGDIAPDGVAYHTRVSTGYEEGSPENSWITGSDLTGVRAGWPVKVDGIASDPAFGSNGRIVLTVGSRVDAASRIIVLDRKAAVIARSAKLPIATAESGADCVSYAPRAPLTAGTALRSCGARSTPGSSRSTRRSRSFRAGPTDPRVGSSAPGRDDPRAELNCSPPAPPSVGLTGTLYLPLQPRTGVHRRDPRRRRPEWPRARRLAGDLAATGRRVPVDRRRE